MIQIENLVKEYRDVETGAASTGVDGVSLTVESGLCYGLLCSNCAGKSTMLRVMTGIFAPTSGTGKIEGDTPY